MKGGVTRYILSAVERHHARGESRQWWPVARAGRMPDGYPAASRGRVSLARIGGVWVVTVRPYDDGTGRRTTTTTYADFATAARAAVAIIEAVPLAWRHIARAARAECSGGPECPCDHCADERMWLGDPPDEVTP